MIYLLLCILSSTAILIIFKLLGKASTKTFPVIVINYLVASVLGYGLNDFNADVATVYSTPWFPLAVIIGVFFVVGFYLIAKSSQKAGIAVTSVASKMSVIIPIVFSIVYDSNDKLTFIKTAGVICALIAVVLTVYRKRGLDVNVKYIYLPIILFLSMGIIDSIVRYSQYKYINDSILPFFTATLFSIAAIAGILFSVIRRYPAAWFLNGKTLIFGTLLGLANFGSIYFIIKALNQQVFAGSIVYGINNIGIVGLSVVLAQLLFNEKLNRINWIGIGLAIAAIVILSYSQNF